MTTQASVQHLNQRASRSEPAAQAFDALVRRHSADLYRFAVWLCGDRALAEDLVQDTLLRAWRSYDHLLAQDAAKSWLITILRRELLRHNARGRRHDSLDAIDDLPSPRTEHDTTTEAVVLRHALSRLPREYREPLILQVLFGFDLNEIARLLGISSGGAATRVFRARQKLRAALGDGADPTGFAPPPAAPSAAFGERPANCRGKVAARLGGLAAQRL